MFQGEQGNDGLPGQQVCSWQIICWRTLIKFIL